MGGWRWRGMGGWRWMRGGRVEADEGWEGGGG